MSALPTMSKVITSVSEPVVITRTVQEVLHELETMHAKMSVRNNHRETIRLAASAIIYLSKRISALESAPVTP